jgi:hypothetical protein
METEGSETQSYSSPPKKRSLHSNETASKKPKGDITFSVFESLADHVLPSLGLIHNFNFITS